MTTTANAQTGEWPAILQRFVEQRAPSQAEYLPRRVRRRFHGVETTLWQGFVHIDDIEGYVENIRLKFYLNRWRARRGDLALRPTSEDIYGIMLEADREEPQESRKPFHIERMAQNITRNGVQEPIIVYADGRARAELWDGNRRLFGTMHIMREARFRQYQDQARWLPTMVVTPTGSPEDDQRIKHHILTELNFVEKDHIPWPAYVKAEQIYLQYERMTAADPTDPMLRRQVREQLAKDYGLKGWRVADRWIKMYDLAMQFREYHEEEHHRDGVDVDLKIQEKFEYFDELSKPGVWGALKSDPDARDDVFCWLWDDKFKAFTDVRMVPRILADPVARRQASAEDADSVKRAIATVIANDPVRVKDKEAANQKIAQFAEWLDSFKREDYRQLDVESLKRLKAILEDVVKILEGLLASPTSRAGSRQ